MNVWFTSMRLVLAMFSLLEVHERSRQHAILPVMPDEGQFMAMRLCNCRER